VTHWKGLDVGSAANFGRRSLLMLGAAAGGLLVGCTREVGADGERRPIDRTRDLIPVDRTCGLRVDDGVISVVVPACDGPVWFAGVGLVTQSSTHEIVNRWTGIRYERSDSEVTVLSADAFDDASGEYSARQSMWVTIRSERVGRKVFWLGTDEAVFPSRPDMYVNPAGEQVGVEEIRVGGEACGYHEGELF